MENYNLSTDEITKVLTLYSKITSNERRIYAQGYLNGLGAAIILEGKNKDQQSETA